MLLGRVIVYVGLVTGILSWNVNEEERTLRGGRGSVCRRGSEERQETSLEWCGWRRLPERNKYDRFNLQGDGDTKNYNDVSSMVNFLNIR